MVNLFCAIVGAAESVFPVDIDAGQSVGGLKKAINVEKSNLLKSVDAHELRLFLAQTTDGKWLPSYSEDVQKLKKGKKTTIIKALIEEDRELQGEDAIANLLAGGVIILYQIWGKDYHIRDIPLIWHNSTKSSSGRQVY